MSWLAGTKFAVFGLGDSTYSILAFGHIVDGLLIWWLRS